MLPSEIYRQVRRIHIRSRRLVDGIFAGEYHSVFKGRGIEFADVREYAPGDDVRTIDWNVTARLGHPYVKQHVEERELTVMFVVDLSASGRFGSGDRFKSDIATEVCAVLALSAIRNNDKVGLILFTDRVEKFVPPQKGRRRVLRIIRDLLYFEPRGTGTDIGRALEYLHSISRRHTVSFLVSDFLSRDFEQPLRMVHRRHDIIPISVSDERERRLPPVGFVTFEDLESGGLVLVDTASTAVRNEFGRRKEAALARRRQLFRSIGIDTIELYTHEPYIDPLMRFFQRRERRLAQGR